VLHHVDLLEKELVVDGGKGGERALAPEMDADVLVTLVEPTKHVEDQCAVSDVLVEVSEVVGHLLEALAILGDGGITLRKHTKFGIEVEGAGLLVAEEVILDGELGLTGGGTVVDHGVGEVSGDRAVEPWLDDDVHPSPVSKGRDGVTVDVVQRWVFGVGEEELLAPTGVVVDGVEDGRHQAACFLHEDRLGVEVEDGSGLVEHHGVGDAHVAARVKLFDGINHGGGVDPGLDRPSEGNADVLRGGVALVGGVGGFLLSCLGDGQSSLVEGATSLDVGLWRSIAVLARLIGRIDEGGGRSPNHTDVQLVCAGAAKGREGRIPVSWYHERGWLGKIVDWL
jgi:hypothetical protein